LDAIGASKKLNTISDLKKQVRRSGKTDFRAKHRGPIAQEAQRLLFFPGHARAYVEVLADAEGRAEGHLGLKAPGLGVSVELAQAPLLAESPGQGTAPLGVALEPMLKPQARQMKA
jgi:hypothetical protein